jgi:hypothetical protein
VLQDPSGVADHVIDDLLGWEDLAYLSGHAAGEPWPGAEELFGVLLDVVFDGEDTLLEESFGFGLTIVLPDEKLNKSIPWVSDHRLCSQLTNRRCKGS